MKVGVRKPSVKKSIKARTTGKAKRAVKKAVIPGYGKKGVGWIKDPKRAAYNKVYHKTTIGVGDIVKGTTRKSSKSRKTSTSSAGYRNSGSVESFASNYKIKIKGKPGYGGPIALIIIGAIFLFVLLPVGILLVVIALALIFRFRNRVKKGYFATPEELDEWRTLLTSFGVDVDAKASITTMTNASVPIVDKCCSGLSAIYEKIQYDPASLKKKDITNLLSYSDILPRFQKYFEPKNPAFVYSDELVAYRRLEGTHKFIDAEYQKAVAHAATLKTDAGKANQAERFKKSMAEIFAESWPEFMNYAEEKVDIRDFVTIT